MRELDVDFNRVLPLWWAYLWRSFAFAMIAGGAFGAVGNLLAAAYGEPESARLVGGVVGGIVAFPASIVALWSAFRARYSAFEVRFVRPSRLPHVTFVEVEASIERVFAVWWAVTWRTLLIVLCAVLLLSVIEAASAIDFGAQPEPIAPGMAAYQKLLDGGVPQSEIDAWQQRQNQRLIDGGVPLDKINEYWGGDAPQRQTQAAQIVRVANVAFVWVVWFFCTAFAMRAALRKKYQSFAIALFDAGAQPLAQLVYEAKSPELFSPRQTEAIASNMRSTSKTKQKRRLKARNFWNLLLLCLPVSAAYDIGSSQYRYVNGTFERLPFSLQSAGIGFLAGLIISLVLFGTGVAVRAIVRKIRTDTVPGLH